MQVFRILLAFLRFADWIIPGISGLQGRFPQSGPLFESSLLPWQGFTVGAIRNSLFFIGFEGKAYRKAEWGTVFGEWLRFGDQ
jgi:hypothetical protein